MTPNPHSVMRLTPDDAAAYRALMLQAYAESPLAFTSSPEDRAHLPLSWWASRLRSDTPCRVWGVWHPTQAQTLMGAVGLDWPESAKTAHKGHLFGMVVQAPWRQQGLGRALLQTALSGAPDHLRVMQLTVSQGNAAALALYESMGFCTWGVEPHALRLPNGESIAKCHMTLSLR